MKSLYTKTITYFDKKNDKFKNNTSLHIQPRLITGACVKVTSYTNTLKKKIFWSFLYCLNTKQQHQKKRFKKMIERMRNLPVYKQENLTINCSSLSVILSHMIMLLLFKRVHLFAPPSRHTTLNSALQRALKHFNNACSTTRGSISSDPLT